MLIENVAGEDKPYHVPSGIGKALIAAGVAREVLPVVAPTLMPNTTWNVRNGHQAEDYSYQPQILYSCSSCGNKGYMEGPTVHKTQNFIHCGIHESVPPSIQEQYALLRAAWERKFGRKKEKVSQYTPQVLKGEDGPVDIYQHFGVATIK